MAHFAKIENNLVTQVIVAEQSFIDTLQGTWVQTSYNTYGNVHYGSDGQPDGGIALRGNYAGIGYTYDSVLDAFYAPKPADLYELNPTTFLWDVKAEYVPLVFAAAISAELVLPTATAGEPITVTSVEIRNGAKVLFTNVPHPGIYGYNQSTGTFTHINEPTASVVISDDYANVYKFNGTAWVSEAVV